VSYSDTLEASKTEARSLRVQLQQHQSVIPQLESERDGLAAEVAELREVLDDAEKRVGSSSSALNQLKTDTERRLREKDDESQLMR